MFPEFTTMLTGHGKLMSYHDRFGLIDNPKCRYEEEKEEEEEGGEEEEAKEENKKEEEDKKKKKQLQITKYFTVRYYVTKGTK